MERVREKYEEPEALKSLLDYFESLVPQDEFTGKLDEAVTAARAHKEWRREYMTFELLMMDSRREGKEEGIKEGIEKGELKKLTEQVCRKLLKGKTPEIIS